MYRRAPANQLLLYNPPPRPASWTEECGSFRFDRLRYVMRVRRRRWRRHNPTQHILPEYIYIHTPLYLVFGHLFEDKSRPINQPTKLRRRRGGNRCPRRFGESLSPDCRTDHPTRRLAGILSCRIISYASCVCTAASETPRDQRRCPRGKTFCFRKNVFLKTARCCCKCFSLKISTKTKVSYRSTYGPRGFTRSTYDIVSVLDPLE